MWLMSNWPSAEIMWKDDNEGSGRTEALPGGREGEKGQKSLPWAGAFTRQLIPFCIASGREERVLLVNDQYGQLLCCWSDAHLEWVMGHRHCSFDHL